MNYAEYIITIRYGIYNYTHCKDIKNLVNRFALHKCFAVNTVNTLYSAAYVNIFYYIICFFKNLIFYRFNKLVTVVFGKADSIFNLLVTNRVKVLQRQILKLVFYGFDTEAVSNRSIYLHIFVSLISSALLRHTAYCTHIMQTVGKFNNNYSDVVCHCNKHFSDVFCLSLLS